jgi:hypothetical protein
MELVPFVAPIATAVALWAIVAAILIGLQYAHEPDRFRRRPVPGLRVAVRRRPARRR